MPEYNDISSCLNSEAPMAPLCYTLLFAVSSGIINLLKNLNGFFYKSFKLTNAYKLRTQKGVYLGPSSETQGQLVGTTGFSWAKVYNKTGRAPGHLFLPNEFQKRLKSRLLIGQKNFFLVNQRRGTAGRLSCLLTRGCFPHQSP